MTLLPVLVLLAQPAAAYSTGRTGSSTSGCTTCHGSSSSSATTVTFDASSTTVEPGETIDVTLTVAHASQTGAGLDVSATCGSLAAGADTRLSSGEITHSSAAVMSSGSYTFDFTWTAPTSEGTCTLRGAGNAVNRNSAATGDVWNLATSLELTVDDGCEDADSDGYSDCDGDCDDGNRNVNPGATERCNDIDDDCDGGVDEAGAAGETTWYMDLDRDGYGNALESVRACDQPDGYVADATDCDDVDGSVHPGVKDVPDDGIDQDCDGSDAGGGDDTGTPPDDTGTPPDDTGTPPDDTGTPPDDTGTPPDDTGDGQSDGGDADGGCGCGTTGSGLMAPLALLGLVALVLARRAGPPSVVRRMSSARRVRYPRDRQR